MAVITATINGPAALPGLAVNIVIEGEVATELDVPDHVHIGKPSNEKLPWTCHYIEAQAGKIYSISFFLSPPFKIPDEHDCVLFHAYIDEIYYASSLVQGSQLHNSRMGYKSEILAVPKNSDTVERPMFSNLRSNEESDSLTTKDDMKRITQMGKIIVNVATGELGKIDPHPPPPSDHANLSMEFSHKAIIQNGRGITHGSTQSPQSACESHTAENIGNEPTGISQNYNVDDRSNGRTYIDLTGED
ncbi:hypothetical protein FHETE_10349 [Fusarium heterosporum]|uniref:DUF7918 domain-containing protein n=1 Tax=Fusarium heterosporum TaxID=42747 RepID=A0A8H5WGG4_FUSHE|nr:hypothetical protein FHETE_10349 [Fusarium heterosporum]